MKSAVKVLAVLVVLVVVVTGAVFLLYPSTPKDPSIPEVYAYANDYAGALTQDEFDTIDYICYLVDQNSSCQMAVLVVNTTQPHDIDYFALRAFQYGQVGVQGRDNGVLIVVATDDRTWRVEVGYGLEGILTDVRVDHLAQEYLEPNMTAGNYGAGLISLTDEMGWILATEYTGDRSGNSPYPINGIPLDWTGWLIVVVIFIGLIVVTRGRVLWPILLLISVLGGGRGKFGGGRSGGGGASGRT